MIKKYKFLTHILFILLVGCGYNSVLNDNSSNFTIASIDVSGDSNINDNILINLENYLNNSEKEKKYFLKINSIENKNITSKDEKGDPKTYNIEIKTTIEVSNINGDVKKKKFLERKNYNTMSSKFELNLYEKNLKKDIANIIARKISIYLSTLN